MDANELQAWQMRNTGASDELRRQFGPQALRSARDKWDSAQHALPDQCDLCGSKPFHSRDACLSMATSDNIQLLLDALVSADLQDASEDATDAALDMISELQFHLEAVKRRENAQIAASVEQDRQRVKSVSGCPDRAHQREWVAYHLSQRSTTLGVIVPSELAKLGLPPRREDAPVDFSRVLVRMSPRWPWYPPPPLEPTEVPVAKQRIMNKCSLPGDERLVSIFDAECMKWLSGVSFFLCWFNGEKAQLEKLQTARRLRPSVLSQTELEEEFRTSLIPHSHVRYADVMRDPTAPLFVCQWRERSFSELRGFGQYAHIVWYVLTNA